MDLSVVGTDHSVVRASLDGRRFRASGEGAGGEVDAQTVFEYQEAGGVIWARYQGGAIELGFLVGTRSGDQLDFRYTQLNRGGATASGHCVSQVETLADGRLRLHETWTWESRSGSGTSVVEEIG